MEIGETLYVKDREKWRTWLSKNYDTKKEIWLVYYNKASGKQRIPYNDAVEEALCYGWIDGIIKRIDEERFVQRFSPRRKGSILSEMNKQRIRMMIQQGKMTDFGLKAVEHAFDKEKDRNEKFIFPEYIIKEIKKNKKAWENFQKFPEHYKRIRITYIGHQGERSEEDFKKKLDYFIKMTEKNKRYGMMR